MLSFIGYQFHRPDIILAIPDFLIQIKKSLFMTPEFSIPSHSASSLYNPYINSTSSSKKGFVTLNEKHLKSFDIPRNIIQIGNDAVNDELYQSLELTKWPCESFRDLIPFRDKVRSGLNNAEAHLLRDKLKMSPAMAAANCSNPLVKCSVRFDLQGG
jgi:hypothetical protein